MTANIRSVLLPNDSMTTADAERILAEHIAWVPLPGGPTEAHVGKRLRVVWSSGVAQSIAREVSRSRDAVRLGGIPGEWDYTSGAWFIHPDDVPTAPDADLIEKMAQVVLDNFHGPDDKHGTWHLNPETVARAALAVVRDHEAQR